jgi:hypothetical protein
MDTNPGHGQLDEQMKALRTDMEGVDTPRAVEQQLMAAFAQRHGRRRWHQRFARPQWALAGAGSLAALAVAMLAALNPPVPMRAGAPQLVQRDGSGIFIALEPLERIEREANPRMIETELPRMELASLGVPVTPENAGESVLAEMLVSADGQPLALRLSSTQ